MSSSTPLHPAELAPFALIPLINPVFSHQLPSSKNTPNASPVKASSKDVSNSALLEGGIGSGSGAIPPSSSISRLSQLASKVTPNSLSSSSSPATASATSVRSVEASGDKVWVGGSDGRMRIYEVGSVMGPGGYNSSRDSFGGSPRTSESGRSTPTSPALVSGLDLLQEVVVTMGKKAADRIALLERLDKAVLLSEGVLTFHSLPSLTPLSVHQFPAMKGVTTFSVNEDELAGGGKEGEMHVCAIKRKTMYMIRVTKESASIVRELPLKGGALLSVHRRNIVCIADAMNYSIVDLDRAIAIALMPISQSPNLDSIATPSNSLPSTSEGAPSPPPTIPGLDPRQRPAVACVGADEFLIASHTGSTTLGVFIHEGGEPCRGTLEWGSNLRSLSIDYPYVIGLLHNNTIEIHSIETLEIVQVIPLPISSSASIYSLQPRSIIRSWTGVDLIGEGNDKIEWLDIPLFSSNIPSSALDRFSTPPRKTLSCLVSPHPSRGNLEQKGKAPIRKGTKARTLLVGKNSLSVLAPWSLIAQTDALFSKGREADAVSLARQIEKSEKKEGERNSNPEITYVYLRAAYIALRSTRFQEAFNLFLEANSDPRLVVRMFPDLRDPLLRIEETLSVLSGVREDVMEGKTIAEYIMDDLNRNYSPHIKPDVESAASTVELRTVLATSARDSLGEYLSKWRGSRRSLKNPSDDNGGGDSRKVDMVVDTTLVKLLAEHGSENAIRRLLDGTHDCVVQHVESDLLAAKLYELTASIYMKRVEVRKALDIWTKIVEGIYVDPSYTGGLSYIYNLLWDSGDRDLVETYGIWLLGQDRDLALKLFTDSRQSHTFDTRSLFTKLRAVDPNAADQFLESVVLQKRDTDSALHADLVKRYVDRLGELLADADTKAHLRAQESAYSSLASASTTPPSFLAFLASRYDPSSVHASFDLARLKTILFLSTSSKYDVAGTKQELDEMELKGLKGLTMERVVVYGKLRLDRQALSLLLYSLKDLSSAETYCHQGGDPIVPSEISSTATILSLSMPRSPKSSSTSNSGSQKDIAGEQARRVELARLLVEMCLKDSGIAGAVVGNDEQVARILTRQSIHLEPILVLPLLPPSLPISLLTSFLSRSISRSLHAHHEASLFKGLASSQNLEISERLGELQLKLGGTLQSTGDLPGVQGMAKRGDEEIVMLVEKKSNEKGEENEVIDLGPSLN